MADWLGSGWSALHRLTDRREASWYDKCEDRVGLYRLVGLQEGSSIEPRPINRACGTDASGTIYIGTGGSLRGRIAELVKQHDRARYLSRDHKALTNRLAEVFPPDRLAVCWLYLNEAADNYKAERDLRAAYVEVFGEPPPLNSMP